MDKPLNPDGSYPVVSPEDLEYARKAMERSGGRSIIMRVTGKDPGTSLPEEVHLLPEKRIGDDTRDRYIAHLRQLYARGYMDLPEFTARLDAASAAKTQQALIMLIRDLPEDLGMFTEKQEPQAHQRFPGYHPVAYLCWAVSMCITALIAQFALHASWVVYDLFSLMSMMYLILLNRSLNLREKK